MQQGCVGVKLSTEDSGNSWEFIEWVKNSIIDEVLPLHVKVGGPDAKNDIRTFLRLNASGIIGPMIESPFGVQKFVQALQTIVGSDVMKQKTISVNLESISAYENLDKILDVDEMVYVNKIVVGSTDLSKSMGQPVSSPEVINTITEMCKKSKMSGKSVRLGGVMSMIQENKNKFLKLIADASPDEINTRVLSFDVEKSKDLDSAYRRSVQFEAEVNQLWVEINKIDLEQYEKRASSLKKSVM